MCVRGKSGGILSARPVSSRRSRVLGGSQVLEEARYATQDFYFLKVKCECGQRAGFRLQFKQMAPHELFVYDQYLDICPHCYRLEVFSAHDNDRPIPFVHLLPVVFIPA